MTNKELIRLDKVAKYFTNPERQELCVLHNINLQLYEGEIVVCVGKSGSGKSTLLRIIAGLEPPSKGEVYYLNNKIQGPIDGVAMVFQNFALLPWLTVLENVELGLEALGMKKHIRRQRSLQAIDTIGLDGFESAYPRELSGGMQQRVGFARALVVQPEILLMDEPFSSLDVLTAENLRNDLLDLWRDKHARTKGIFCITHDIEEAVLMATKVLVFSSDPGEIQKEVAIDLPYPRDTRDPLFKIMMDRIYTLMTVCERERYINRALTGELADFSYRLPEVGVSELTGLMEAMETHEKHHVVDLLDLANDLHLDINNLFPLIEVLNVLAFTQIIHGDVQITPAGKEFIGADILKRKQLFATQLVAKIPLAQHITMILDEAHNNKVHEDNFITKLTNHFSEDEADKIFKTMIDWGRYAEIFAYDWDTGILSLENPQ